MFNRYIWTFFKHQKIEKNCKFIEIIHYFYEIQENLFIFFFGFLVKKNFERYLYSFLILTFSLIYKVRQDSLWSNRQSTKSNGLRWEWTGHKRISKVQNWVISQTLLLSHLWETFDFAYNKQQYKGKKRERIIQHVGKQILASPLTSHLISFHCS